MKPVIDPNLTVAEIVRLHPAAAPVLARFGLDSCCGGRHPLAFVCRAREVSLEEVLSALAAALPDAAGQGGAPVHAGMTVREVIEAHPATIPVFARHGLMGCGGSQGPVEPLGWFAHVHHAELGALIAELNEAALRGGPAAAPPPLTPAEIARENFYRRFLKAALLFTLTGGTALGAWALLWMAQRGAPGGLGRGVIQVHGHFQLYGWVGLFIVGVAYHILPRLTGVPLASYRLASFSFVALTAGTLLRTAQSFDPSFARSLLLVSGALLELAGAAVFLHLVRRILRSPAAPRAPWQRYVHIGSLWFVAASALNLQHAAWLARAGTFEIPPAMNLPYLTVFVVGFVTFWILGVSLRTLPVFMGLRARPARAGALAVPLAVATGVLAFAEAAFVAGGARTAGVLAGLAGLAVAACLGLFVWWLGVLAPPRRPEAVPPGDPALPVLDDRPAAAGPAPGSPELDRRYEKFVRLGYVWLAVSGAMLAALSVPMLAGSLADHAFTGAFRHALTVGFITTMIVGMACRIVPVFRGVPLWSHRLLEATFWLLAAGSVVRVLFQTVSGFAGPAWMRAAALSGPLELAAVALFGVNIWMTMNAPTPDEEEAAGWKPPIGPQANVAELISAYPALLPVFVGSGFTSLANPLLRRTLARGVSVEQACRMHGVDLDRFLGKLSAAKDAPPS